MAHEIAHILGISERLRGIADSCDSFIAEETATFNGAYAVVANSGRPVSFQWQIGRNHVRDGGLRIRRLGVLQRLGYGRRAHDKP